MNPEAIVDELARLGGWIEPPSTERRRWRVHEPSEGLPANLRERIQAWWPSVQQEALRRQRAAMSDARAAARKHLPARPTKADRERAIDFACSKLMAAVLRLGVDVPEMNPAELLKGDSGAVGAGA